MLFRSDRKSTRLNSSHLGISYAVFCLLAVIAFDHGVAVLRETAPGVSVQQVLAATGATLAVADDVTEMHIEGDAS